MARLGIDLDPIAFIRNTFNSHEPDPAHTAVFCEIGGTESVTGYLRDDYKTINERDVYILKEIVKSHLNIRVNINENAIKKLYKIKPDMITFVSPGSVSSIQPLPVNIENYSENLKDYVADLRANNIISSIFIEPEISMIKMAGKIEFDFVELHAVDLAEAKSFDQEISELEKLNSACIAAQKLGMGTNISGGINHENIRDIARLQSVDDIYIDYAIIQRALAVGYEQAVRDIINYI